jgi:hypothetical protein
MIETDVDTEDADASPVPVDCIETAALEVAIDGLELAETTDTDAVGVLAKYGIGVPFPVIDNRCALKSYPPSPRPESELIKFLKVAILNNLVKNSIFCLCSGSSCTDDYI